MREDRIQADELLNQLADYKNDFADVAAQSSISGCFVPLTDHQKRSPK